ncbi:integrase, catalytic region, zinc finger, CCHC-type containing protein [Tanacetum coccineum]
MHMLTKPQIFYNDTHKQDLGYQNPFYLKKAQRIKPTLYDGVVISRKHDVVFCEQAFWLPISNPISEQLVVQPTPVKIEVPSQLPKKCFEIQKKELLLENDRLLELIISQDLVHTGVNSLEVTDECESMRKSWCEEYNRNLKLKNNREAHEDYLKKTKEHTDTLCGTVEQARKPNHSDPYLDYACKFTIRVQELSSKSSLCTLDSEMHLSTVTGQRSHSSLVEKVSWYAVRFGHNLFSVGQFCDSDLEVAFQKHTFFVRNLEGVDLLTSSKGTNLYTLSLADMMRSSPICLLSKASKTKSWLCHRRKRKNHTHKPKSKDSIQEKLYLLHMDLCRPMRIESTNGKKYILNGVVERQNWTLVEVARTMLISSKAPLYLWAEAVAMACYTQNRSLIRKRKNKTPYELLHDRKPDLKYLHVFGALCYPTNDNKDLGKLKPKADIGISIGYAPAKKAYRIYNRRTWQIMEIIHIDFDELTTMAYEQSSSGPTLHEMAPGTISSGLM